MSFRGAFTALVTPFKNGAVDEEAYRAFIEWQIEQGIDGVVPCGTTGEAATLSHAEQGQVIKICVDQVKGRVPVIAGAGSNNTREAMELVALAKQAGADAALIITPYYNKPTPDGLVAHFKALAAETSMPFILYNVPGRTGQNVLPKTIARIAKEVPEVIGCKEATGDIKQGTELIEAMGRDFTVLSGDDFTVLPLLSVGGHGTISVTSNVMPAKMSGMITAFGKRDTARAQALNLEMMPVNRAMFLETNPIPVKTALSLMGKMGLEFRLPLVPLESCHLEQLKKVLAESGLI
ncbi:MAG TPA: 4-hydroxy-tetrahydrodipicolinate synthase [Humidesulfovibrio sp.]|uniref:4-hydroxy-tetrahydrodipicolinate synthase n=1 Tax=Humidesulfovibrio sp. TaxID=2910988 RepID=UPI002C3E356E|nr:4-hydroxy-tetrahydrodipicolinate synthase [Humidesulfovibrio sp.]HWR02735.1 4-hydroxy-tetrahydrodipicolinate synthase [Humidesulfovibrio sp.]